MRIRNEERLRGNQAPAKKVIVRSANFVAPCPLHLQIKLAATISPQGNCDRVETARPIHAPLPPAANLPIQVVQIVQFCHYKLSKLCNFVNPSCQNCPKLPIQSLHHCPAPKSLLRPTRLVLKDEATGLKLVELCQRFPTQNSAPP